jgi:hypothetical protein
VAVPAISPVAALRVSPEGRVPEAIDHVVGAFAPDTLGT